MIYISIFFVIALLILGGLISATETAITVTSPGLIQKLKLEGHDRAKHLLKLLKMKDKVISTLLISSSIANTLCITIATGVSIDIFGENKGTLASSIIMPFSIIIFSEAIPKAIAVIKSKNIALAATPILIICLRILEPLNVTLNYITQAFCSIFNINLQEKISATDEVRGVIEHHVNEGNVLKNDRDMLEGILNIQNLIIADIMTHRSNIITININSSIDYIIYTAISSNHTRIPFWEHNHDNIIGILHIKNLLSKIYNIKYKSTKINIRSLLSNVTFIPESSLVTKQLQIFQGYFDS